MKKLLMMIALVAGISYSGQAQVKPQQTVKIATPTATCAQCKARIESYLKRYDGVTLVNVNFRKGETTVKFLSDRTNVENLKAAISNAGYDAAELAAFPEAYNALPKPCKKPEDGGHKKPKT